MPPTEPATPQRKPRNKGREAAPQPADQAPPDLVSVTIDAANGRIVGLERVDETGARHALSADEKAAVSNGARRATIARLVEQAFEAGIECVLGEGGEEEPQGSKADDELSHILLQSLLERSKASQLVQAEVLNQAIVGTLIEEAATPEPELAH